MSKPKAIYLIAKYYAKPKHPGRTFIKGYMKNEENIAYDEQIAVTKGLRDKDLLSSKIVLNISEQKVVHNAFQNDKSFTELFEYFYNGSPQYIGGALRELGVSIKGTEDEQSDVSEESKEAEGSERPAETHALGPSQGVEGHEVEHRPDPV